jgi:two-component system, OmpR family, aerobic respiration control sensor histidine kinase ArcB
MKSHVRSDINPMADELALLGHDIRSAVTEVMAGLILIDDSHLGPADRLQLDRAKATTESLVRYLEEGLTTLLAQAPPTLESTPTDLGQLLKDLSRRWCHSANGTQAVIITASKLPATVLCNRTALDRILSNLISNAIAYSNAAPIRLAVSHPSPDQLCFTITDQGPGFPSHIRTAADAASALPAWQSRDGHGLGLCIAQTLAQRMGARLTLENAPKNGGVATLFLPVIVAPDQGTAAPRNTNCLQGKKVLIADDSMAQLLLLAQFLCDYGAQITMVRDGVAAQNAIAANRFDLALIDLEMPGRTGLEICQTFRDRQIPADPHTRIVILTAHHLPMIHQNALAAGAAQVLVKPITSSQTLVEALCRDIPQTTPPPQSPESNDSRAFLRLLAMAGPELASELLTRYQEDLLSVQTTLTAALPGFDWPNLRGASHVLIALAGTAGMASLEQAARTFNLAVHDTNHAAVTAQQDALLTGLAELLDYVQQIAEQQQE